MMPQIAGRHGGTDNAAGRRGSGHPDGAPEPTLFAAGRRFTSRHCLASWSSRRRRRRPSSAPSADPRSHLENRPHGLCDNPCIGNRLGNVGRQCRGHVAGHDGNDTLRGGAATHDERRHRPRQQEGGPARMLNWPMSATSSSSWRGAALTKCGRDLHRSAPTWRTTSWGHHDGGTANSPNTMIGNAEANARRSRRARHPSGGTQ